MYTLLLVLLTAMPNARAQEKDPFDCQSYLLFEVDAYGVYFNRWRLDPTKDLQSTLHQAINDVSDRTRPLLILDTNPNPDLWGEANLIRPNADQQFPGRGYHDLSPVEKAGLFTDFVNRADATLRSKVRAVLTIDHHFDSELLSTASTTPMIVDFLNWLNAQPETPKTLGVRTALSRAMVLRDHSDADIVLSSFAATLVDDPGALQAWGPLISRIAYYNDHALLDDNLTAIEKTEVVLGYAVMRGYEDYIQFNRPGGFEVALKQMSYVLGLVRYGAHAFANSPDPVREFLDSDGVAKAPGELHKLFEIMESDWTREKDLTDQVRHMLATGENVRREGAILVFDFPLAAEAASGMSVLRLIKGSNSPLVKGAKIMVAVTREPSESGLAVHVKMRTIQPGVRFDHVVNQIRARKMGGGGRGCAAGMYSSAGCVVSPEVLEKDLRWLINQLGQ